jgi:hypothetical protein
MADNDKRPVNPQPQPLREHYEYAEESLKERSRTQDVSNTLPAPDNPHRENQGGNKKGQ